MVGLQTLGESCRAALFQYRMARVRMERSVELDCDFPALAGRDGWWSPFSTMVVMTAETPLSCELLPERRMHGAYHRLGFAVAVFTQARRGERQIIEWRN